MKKFDYFQPENLKEAYELMEKQKGNARYIAGGTDIIWRIKQCVIETDALISLRGIESLKKSSLNGGLTLGSMVLFRDIVRNQDISSRYPALQQAVSLLANPQVRNVATIGGNICNAAPSADCAPPLMVSDAMLTLEGPGGKREIPINDFFTGPGQTCMEQTEVLTHITLPEMDSKASACFLKKGRVSQDIAIVNAAALLVMEGNVCRKCRLCVGAVAPVPLRMTMAEEIVEGQEITLELLNKVAELVEKEVSPITDVRSTEEYRRAVSGVLARRALQAAYDRSQ